jgi:replication-associated recombination protein RarA
MFQVLSFLLTRFIAFNKSQQDSLLGAVEKGIITLMGATTENPSFEVISPCYPVPGLYSETLEEKVLLSMLQKGQQRLNKSMDRRLTWQKPKHCCACPGEMPENYTMRLSWSAST